MLTKKRFSSLKFDIIDTLQTKNLYNSILGLNVPYWVIKGQRITGQLSPDWLNVIPLLSPIAAVSVGFEIRK